jgi:hypothetical protein
VWWVLSDEALREALDRVAAGQLSAGEAYAVLREHADDERVEAAQ